MPRSFLAVAQIFVGLAVLCLGLALIQKVCASRILAFPEASQFELVVVTCLQMQNENGRDYKKL